VQPLPPREKLLDFAKKYNFHCPTDPNRHVHTHKHRHTSGNKHKCKYGFFPTSNDDLLVKTYQIDKSDNSVALVFPVQKKSRSKHTFLRVTARKPKDFMHDLKALLIPAPEPEPVNSFFLLDFISSIWGSITRYCQNLLNRDFGIREFFTTIFNR